MSIFIVLFLVITITFFGFLAIKGFGLLSKEPILTVIGYSYGLGVGFATGELYIYTRIHIPWKIEYIIIPWLVGLLLFFWKKRKTIYIPHKTLIKLNLFEWILFGAIILTILYTFFESILRPTSVWDSWAIWLLKSKMFFIDGKIIPSSLGYVLSDYPVVISLLGTFVYLFLGKVNDTAVLVVFFSFYFFLAVLFFSVLKNRIGIRMSLLFTLFLVTTQTIIRQGGRLEAGQADLALGYFFLICFLLFIKFLEDKTWQTLLILNMFLAITGLTKLDGQPFVLLILTMITLSILVRKKIKELFFLLFSVIPLLDWRIFVITNHIQFLSGGAKIFESFSSNFLGILKKELVELVNIKSWNLLWIMYFYTFITNQIKRRRELIFAHVLILSQLFLYTFLYIFSPHTYTPESSFERLLVHIAPIALFAIALTFSPLIRSFKIFKINKQPKTFSENRISSRQGKR